MTAASSALDEANTGGCWVACRELCLVFARAFAAGGVRMALLVRQRALAISARACRLLP
jgi:hypothetical protein